MRDAIKKLHRQAEADRDLLDREYLLTFYFLPTDLKGNKDKIIGTEETQFFQIPFLTILK